MAGPTSLSDISKHYLNWIIEPVGQCTRFLAEEITLHTVITRGVIAMQSVPMLIQMSRLALQNLPTPPNTDKASVEQALQFLAANTPADAATEIRASDFAIPNAHSFIALWAVLEACLGDTFALVLMNDAKARDAVRKAHPTLKLNDNALDDKACLRAARQWEGFARNGRSIAQAWVAMFACVDITVPLDASTDAAITEANAIRNVLMHRLGRIDAHAASQAPSLANRIGQTIAISRSEYSRLFDALRKFTTDLTGGVVASRFIRTKPAAATP